MDGDIPGRFRVSNQPWSGLWFDAIESGKWGRFALVAPPQVGKTLLVMIVILYHLFEIEETVIFGIPEMEMAADKWRIDLLPLIQATRFAALLPDKGSGSKGGFSDLIEFKNGARLKFMSGSGGDNKRAGFTSRVLVATEIDKMDSAKNSSRESSPIDQMETRQLGYENSVSYLECTVSTADGAIWKEWLKGSGHQPFPRCPKCKTHVHLDAEHFVGWREVDNELDAMEQAGFACPSCGATWSEIERRNANENALLVGNGQRVEKGKVAGDGKRTRTFSMRIWAADNMILSAGKMGAQLWKNAQKDDEESADKWRLQCMEVQPYVHSAIDEKRLDQKALALRCGPHGRGVVPPETIGITRGIDVGRHRLHWVDIAWTTRHAYVVNYGIQETGADSLGDERGILLALKELAEMGAQYPHGLAQTFIDSGWTGAPVFAHCSSDKDRVRPVKGMSVIQYSEPKKIDKATRYIGTRYHAAAHSSGVPLWMIDVDFWKLWLHRRLLMAANLEEAVLLYQNPTEKHHAGLARHLTAEVPEVENNATRFRKIRDHNHWLDAATYSVVAADFCQIWADKKSAQAVVKPAPIRGQRRLLTMPDGRAFVATERK